MSLAQDTAAAQPWTTEAGEETEPRSKVLIVDDLPDCQYDGQHRDEGRNREGQSTPPSTTRRGRGLAGRITWLCRMHRSGLHTYPAAILS